MPSFLESRQQEQEKEEEEGTRRRERVRGGGGYVDTLCQERRKERDGKRM